MIDLWKPGAYVKRTAELEWIFECIWPSAEMIRSSIKALLTNNQGDERIVGYLDGAGRPLQALERKSW